MVLFAVCVAAIIRDVDGRRGVAAVVEARGFERRHPAVVETLNVIEGNGEAGLLVAEALVGESDAALRSSGAAAARGLVLRGLTDRPGSAYGRLLLGRSVALDEPPAGWARPLELAVAAAPGLELASSELGVRYLEAWESLTPEERRKGEEALRLAFRSVPFLRASFSRAATIVGPATAVRALPDDPATLRLAEQLVGRDSLAAELIAARLKTVPTAPETSRPSP